MIFAMKKKVFIALKMAGVAGQSKLAGIFRYLSERYPDDSPWDVTLVRTQAELTRELVEKAVSGGTDGFIVSIPETEESVVPLVDVSTPTIVMDIRSAPLERRERNLVTIRNSGEKIGSAAAQYFMGQGVARSYAFLHSEGMHDWDLARFKSYRKALKDNGIWCEELFDPSEALKLKRPAAVFAAYDDRANDLLKLLSSKRVRVPQDIAVLGVDNDTLICENTHPRLSSVMPDFEGEGYLAAETLDSMMHGEGPNSCVLLADIKEVVRRESTCELSSAGRLVQKAVVYIDRHALEGIGVEDVVRHLKCSRRLADLRFRELQKRSILQAITERRLDEVKRRLRETREKIDSIAAACGYTNPNYLKNLFKKRFAMSMSAFRRAAKGPDAIAAADYR